MCIRDRLYDCGDTELLSQWHKAKDLVRDYNQTDSADTEEKERILNELLGGRGKTVSYTHLLLFMKMLTAKDRYSIAVLRAIGFTGSDIKRQYAWRAFLVLSAGILLGTVLAGTLGEKLSAAAASWFGAAAFRFAIDPLSTYLYSPLILVCSGPVSYTNL